MVSTNFDKSGFIVQLKKHWARHFFNLLIAAMKYGIALYVPVTVDSCTR